MTVATVSDVPEDMALVTDPQDVRAVLDCLSVETEDWVHGSLFVETENGQYDRVYWYPGHVPVMAKPVTILF